MSRPDSLVIEQANAVARICLSIIGTGFEAPPGFQFWRSTNPRAQKAWVAAKAIMAELFGDDVDVAMEIEGEE